MVDCQLSITNPFLQTTKVSTNINEKFKTPRQVVNERELRLVKQMLADCPETKPSTSKLKMGSKKKLE